MSYSEDSLLSLLKPMNPIPAVAAMIATEKSQKQIFHANLILVEFWSLAREINKKPLNISAESEAEQAVITL